MNKKSHEPKRLAPFFFDLQKELRNQDSLPKIAPTFKQKGRNT